MHALDDLGLGAVRCVFSSAPATTVERLLIWGTTRPDGERVAVCAVDPDRPAAELIGGLVDSLARAALAVWPSWYADADLFRPGDEASLQATRDRLASRHPPRRRRSVLRAWLGPAAARCRAGTPPVAADLSPSVQVQQLSLAIAADLTLVVRACRARAPDAAGLLALARGLEWLARQAAARVVAVLPAAWAGRAELDGISWDCRVIDAGESESAADTGLDEPLSTVSPVRGRPHPNSPGEQLMAARLGRDPLLGPLFEYNRPVATVRGSRYQVDLVWFAGKLVVEIDGYRCHSSPADFANDRQRDYELQLSGYDVLRLTHASVMEDVELAIDKVRDLVNLRAACPPAPRPMA